MSDRPRTTTETHQVESYRDRSSSQDSGDDGSQFHDEMSSHRSDGGYYSSGAHSDTQYQFSMRSTGSVGSQESNGERRGLIRAHLHGESSRYATSASYMSDTQRSDAATVCSGSVVEDIEIESLLHDEHNLSYAQFTSGSSKHLTPSEKLPPNALIRSRGSSFGGEEATTSRSSPSNTHEDIPKMIPPKTAISFASINSFPQMEHGHAMHSMGPPLPLSRDLLFQKAAGISSQKNSVKSFGSNPPSEGGGHERVFSDDGDGISIPEDAASTKPKSEDINYPGTNSSQRHNNVKYRIDTNALKSVAACFEALKSTGSTTGSENAMGDTVDDCGASLEMESRSIHSQEDGGGSLSDMTEMTKPPPSGATCTSNTLGNRAIGESHGGLLSPSDVAASSLHGAFSEPGRQSPRPSNGRAGRPAHFPLRHHRYHSSSNNSAHHLDSVDEQRSSNNGLSSAFGHSHPLNRSRVGDSDGHSGSPCEHVKFIRKNGRSTHPHNPYRRRNGYSQDYQGGRCDKMSRERSRSRSRSRSPDR